jgi:tRNA(Ile)-lysidine synthase
LKVQWTHKPDTGLQERARIARYGLLGDWASEHGLTAVATAHHADDQAETLLMRLNRGAGVRGLAGMRPVSPVPGPDLAIPLIRPLLSWRRSELAEICDAAGVRPIEDPSNEDQRFERARMRSSLAAAPWLDREAVARSAANLASADDALRWATDVEWERQLSRSKEMLKYRPLAPPEIRRRVVCRAVESLAGEGESNPLRGRELDRLVSILSQGGKATIRGVLCTGGAEWRFSPAPRRQPRRKP